MKKIIDIFYYEKHKYSGFYLLPLICINFYYKAFTIAFLWYVIEFHFNTYKEHCYYCGAVCKNKTEAQNHCLENIF